jgi:hypothetical protein
VLSIGFHLGDRLGIVDDLHIQIENVADIGFVLRGHNADAWSADVKATVLAVGVSGVYDLVCGVVLPLLSVAFTVTV